jgi:Protein of unknown function (DUF2971)
MDETESLGVPEEFKLGLQLESIFMPYSRKQRDGFNEKKKRFVHYTSAEAALSIIKSKRLWMRNTTCMSDYREVTHGFDLLKSFFSDASNKKRFEESLDACAEVAGIAKEAIDLFDQWWNDTQSNTFISSISEHNDDEDLYGRLSMWRAFGGSNTARVALVFRLPLYSTAGEKLNLMFSLVAYLDKENVHAEINSVIKNIQDNTHFLRSVERSRVVAMVFNMLVAGVICLKHKGFHEECEWRVIYAPNRWGSTLIEPSTEVIGGVPQIIYKIPLDAAISDALADLDVARIFDRLIIGPSPYPWAMVQAFVAALTKCGVPEAHNRVCISDIPIRA